MTDSEEGLVLQLQAGDHDALARLYDAYASIVGAVARRILRDPGEAEEIVQEVFVQAWRQAGRFDRRRGTLAAWLVNMARSRALDRVRRRTIRREAADDLPRTAPPQPPEEPMALRAALTGLSDDQRLALELAFYEGLTHSEIAKRLGQPLGTIKTRIRSAMLRLKDVLS
jgi:RNA polymerase sigma-70 factor (ECF subfamily)